MNPYYQDGFCTIYNGDNADILPLLNPCDLLLTDPPYGIDAYTTGTMGGGVLAKQSTFKPTDWDSCPPTKAMIDLARSKAKLQIIWGGNYFNLPPMRGWLVWDKDNGENYFADCELAWTNLDIAVRKFRYRWQGMLQEKMGRDKEVRVHPTQKPTQLFGWCMSLVPKWGTVIDPWMGSGTALVAAKARCKKAIGIERNEAYCQEAVKRLQQEVLAL